MTSWFAQVEAERVCDYAKIVGETSELLVTFAVVAQRALLIHCSNKFGQYGWTAIDPVLGADLAVHVSGSKRLLLLS